MKKIITLAFVLILFVVTGCKAVEDSSIVAQENTKPAETSLNVELKGFAFNPAKITINKGDTVTWTNLDSVGHTITSDENLFESNLFSNGETWSYTFNDAGTFNYFCTPHPRMKGSVIVK